MKKAGRIMLTVISVIVIVMSVMVLICCGSDKGDAEEKEITGITAANIEIEYDGNEHKIAVENTADGDMIYYSVDGTLWIENEIKYSQVGEYTVYFKVVRAGCKDYISSARITIKKQILDGITAADRIYIYDGSSHGITVTGTESDDIITYSTDGDTFSAALEIIEIGEYTVYYKVDRVNGEYRNSCTVKILPKIQGKYVNRDNGVIIVTDHTAILDSVEKPLEYGITGEGTIGEEQLAVSDDMLVFRESEYVKIKDDEKIYLLHAGGNSVYVISGDKLEVGIEFADGSAIVKANGETVATVKNVNYCESAEQRDYASSDVEFEVESNGDITEKTIELTMREVSEYENIFVQMIYDGQEHAFEVESADTILYKIDGEYTETVPKYTEVGEYKIEIVYLTDGYLPAVVNAEMKIIPSIDGTYYTSASWIEITGLTAKINGSDCTCEYIDGKWLVNGTEAELSGGKLIYAGDEYTRQICEVLLVINIRGELLVMEFSDSSEIIVEYKNSGEVTVLLNWTDELMTENIGADGISITLNGEDWYRIPNDDGDGEMAIFSDGDIYKCKPVAIIIIE